MVFTIKYMCSPPARASSARFAGAIVGATAEREDGAAEQTQALLNAHRNWGETF
jgi:hypothetical protein